MRTNRSILLLGLCLGTACASRSAMVRGVSPPILTTSASPDWRLPLGHTSRSILDLRIAVQVDSTGHPRLETINVIGLGGPDNRAAVVAWLHSARFRPAEQAGRAVEGLYRTRVRTRAQVYPIDLGVPAADRSGR